MTVNRQETILILHGWGSSRKKWERVGDILKGKGFNVIIPDLPGFGKSETPPKPWNLDDYAEWLDKFSQAQEKFYPELSEGFFLLGHSFGGSVALKYALKRPESVKKLFLVATSAIRTKTFKKRFLAKVSKLFKIFSFLPFYSLFRKGIYKFIIRKSDYPYSEGVMKETFLRIINDDLSNILFSVKTPTVIIWGEKDNITPLKDARLINQKIENSKLEILENIGHSPHLENPEKLAETITHFLK